MELQAITVLAWRSQPQGVQRNIISYYMKGLGHIIVDGHPIPFFLHPSKHYIISSQGI